MRRHRFENYQRNRRRQQAGAGKERNTLCWFGISNEALSGQQDERQCPGLGAGRCQRRGVAMRRAQVPDAARVDVASHFASGQRLFAYAAGAGRMSPRDRGRRVPAEQGRQREREREEERERERNSVRQRWLLRLCLHSAFLVH